MALPIALQLYSVRKDMEDFRGTLEKVKAMGYDGVEFAGLFGQDAATIKKWCEEIGQVPISAHVPFAEMIEDPADYIRKYEGRCPVVHLKDFYRESVDADEPLYELIGIKSEARKVVKAWRCSAVS